MALFEGDLIGQFKLPEDDHRALVITDGNDDYVIIKGKNANEVYDAEYWGLLARGKDGQTPSFTIGDNGNFIIDGRDTGKQSRGPAGSLGNATILSGTFDMNNQTTPGIYVTTSGTMSNGPSGASDQFTMLVIGNNDVVTQYLHGAGKNEVWVRGRKGGMWSNWRQITQWS